MTDFFDVGQVPVLNLPLWHLPAKWMGVVFIAAPDIFGRDSVQKITLMQTVALHQMWEISTGCKSMFDPLFN